jgi:DNA end-binding protein Ku
LEEKSGARIRYKRVSEKTGREVPFERIVKGYELPRGEYVTLSDEELEAVEPERSHTITVEDFVSLDEVDPLHFDTTYWVVPDDSQGASKAYALLRSAMDASDRIAIARFVLRTKEHLVALRPVGAALALHLMHFPDEIVPASEVDGLPVRAKVTGREVKMAERLVDSLTIKWKPSRYRDTHRDQVLDMIEQKAKGEEIVIPEAPEETAEVVDLMEALEASLAKKRGSRRPAKKASRAKKAAKAKKAS